MKNGFSILVIILVLFIVSSLILVVSVVSPKKTLTQNEKTNLQKTQSDRTFNFKNSVLVKEYLKNDEGMNDDRRNKQYLLDIDTGAIKDLPKFNSAFSCSGFSQDKTKILCSDELNIYVVDEDTLNAPLQVTKIGRNETDEHYAVFAKSILGFSRNGKKVEYQISVDTHDAELCEGCKASNTIIKKQEKTLNDLGIKAGAYVLDMESGSSVYVGNGLNLIAWGEDDNSFFISEFDSTNKEFMTKLWNYKINDEQIIFKDKLMETISIPENTAYIGIGAKNHAGDLNAVYVAPRGNYSWSRAVYTGFSRLSKVSPDGESILLWTSIPETLTGSLYKYEIQQARTTILLKDIKLTDFYWSSDGKKIIYAEYALAKASNGNNYYSDGGDLYVLDIYSGEKTALTKGKYVREYNY